MARKGAMAKEPLRGAARKAFKKERYENLPGPGGEAPIADNPQGGGAIRVPRTSPPVTARPPREKPGERLSPGVYRGAKGGLVGQGGRPILNQPRPPQRPDDVSQWRNPMLETKPAGTYNLPQIFGPQPGQGPEGEEGSASFDMGMSTNPNVPQGPLQGGRWMGGMPAMPENQQPDAAPMDKMYRYPQMPQMPEPSANMGGQYRLSPGVYGTQEQAMQKYNEQLRMQGVSNPILRVPQGRGMNNGGMFVPQNIQLPIDWYKK